MSLVDRPRYSSEHIPPVGRQRSQLAIAVPLLLQRRAHTHTRKGGAFVVPPFLSFLFLLPVCVMAQQHAADLTPLPPGMDELGTGAAGGISEAFDEATTGRGT